VIHFIADLIRSFMWSGRFPRLFNTTSSLVAFTIATPLLLYVGFIIAAIAAAIGLMIFIMILAAVHAIAGDAGVFLFVVAILAGVTYGIYALINDLRTYRYLSRNLPRLNAYKEVLARFNPDTLPEPHRETITTEQHELAQFLATRTRPDLVPETNDPRAILARLTLTPSHFRGSSLETIKATVAATPADPDTLADTLTLARTEYERAQRHTVIGTTVSTTPRLFHVLDDPILTLPLRDRFRHGYVIGKTGSGKTNLLKHLITQDLVNESAGLILLSPEDGIFQSLIPAIPEDRLDDLIYFDPTDTTDPVIGFNPFDFTDADSLSPRERESYLTLKAGETYTIFERALGDLGVKMTTLMQNIAYALLQLPDATILDFDKLLIPHDNSFRQRVATAESIDTRTRQFWTHYDSSTYYKSTYDPVVNRLDPFLRPPLATILSTPALSFHKALNGERPKILFLNVSKLRGEQAAILGQLIIATIQQTLLRREQIPDAARIPYFFYIDEFSLFTIAEQSFIDLFERARKYRCGVTLAHQVTADLPPKLLDVIVGNVATMLVMQLGAGDAPFFARELQLIEYDHLKADRLTEREVERLKREAEKIERTTGRRPANILDDPNERAAILARIREQSEGTTVPAILQNLPTGNAIAKVPSFPYGIPVSIPYLPDPDMSENATRIARSKANYGKTTPPPEIAPPPEATAPAKRTRKKTAALPDDEGERLFKIKVT
jgi:hypothetical protein